LIDLRNASSPFANTSSVQLRLLMLALTSGTWPARVGWDTYTILVCLRVHVLRGRGIMLIAASAAATPEQLKSRFDMSVTRI
jgi:hypothetical protein